MVMLHLTILCHTLQQYDILVALWCWSVIGLLGDRDVLTNGLSVSAVLPDSAAFDVPMCSLAIDMDFDGQQEILVGTYGQVDTCTQAHTHRCTLNSIHTNIYTNTYIQYSYFSHA